MSIAYDPSLRDLNDCDCCEGVSPKTPMRVITNRPGLSAISYRVGTHSFFKRAMLGRLSSSKYPALDDLNTREDDDFSIALFDAWATVLDVLTFYQERIANEAFLRTAIERLSLMHLARLIGYRPQPGVAADVCLAFTVDDAPGAPGIATIDARTKVQSIPEPGETPQIFETTQPIAARAAWNAMRPRLFWQQAIPIEQKEMILQGAPLGLGDMVLIVQNNEKQLRRVKAVTPDPVADTTHVELEAIGTTPTSLTALSAPEALSASPAPDNLFGADLALTTDTVKTYVLEYTWKQEDLYALATVQGWDADEMETLINAALDVSYTPTMPAVDANEGGFAFGRRAAIFGHNAPRYDTLPYSLRYTTYVPLLNTSGAVEGRTTIPATYSDSWETRTLAGDGPECVFLDAVYDGIVPNTWLVLRKADDYYDVFCVKNNSEVSRTEFTLSAKVSCIVLEDGTQLENRLTEFNMRNTTVYAESKPLTLALLPITQPLSGNQIALDRFYGGLQAGQFVAINGESHVQAGLIVGEIAQIKEVHAVRGHTRLTLEKVLENTYVLDTVTINANVAPATHGETQSEILGSGDASRRFQTFLLRQKPLTYVSSVASETGAKSTLELRVNGLLWQEVNTLYGHGPDERIYVTLQDDDDQTFVKFGDGAIGQRVPTGSENIRTTYRKGIGLEGLVKAEQITLMLTRPHGVKSVTNPLAPYGADDREQADAIRENAPVGMRTLGRIVSLQDYEDFARAYAGIAKSLATWTWYGQQRGVFITVAGPNGHAVADAIIEKLLTAMIGAGDAHVPLTVRSYDKREFQIKAKVRVKPDYVSDTVLGEARERLRAYFAFEARRFGQSVTASEVIAVLQGVDGVEAVDLDALYYTGTAATYAAQLAAPLPRAGTLSAEVEPAGLLLLDPRPIDLGEMS